MPSQFYVSGPATVWAGIGAGYAYEFFGFTETGLTVEIVSLQEDIQVDYAGMMPGDVAQLGQEANISGTFTRYDEAVSQKLASFFGPNGVPGAGLNYSVGTLMVTEGAAYPLLIQSPYYFKSQYGSMVPGFAFPASYLSNPHRTILSVRRKAPELQWRAIPTFGTYVGTTFSPGSPPFNGYLLYTNPTSGYPSVD